MCRAWFGKRSRKRRACFFTVGPSRNIAFSSTVRRNVSNMTEVSRYAGRKLKELS